MFKTRWNTFGNDFGPSWNFEMFFLKIFRDSTPHGLVGKNFLPKKSPNTRLDTWEQFWTILELWNVFDFFSWVFSKYLPQILSPGNWIQTFQVQKSELLFLSSRIWSHNFKSRKSEMGLRILTVAWMQEESLLSIVSENWTLIFKSGKLSSYFQVQKIWKALHGTLGKKNRKNRHKACSKHIWRLLETILCTFGMLNFFEFWKKIEGPTLHGTRGYFFFEKIATKHVQNKFGQF